MTAADACESSRRVHRLGEPVHAVTYVSSTARHQFDSLGFVRPWSGYFANRTSPLGSAAHSVVASAFYHFSPSMVKAEMADLWASTTPEEVITLRTAGASLALSTLLHDKVDSSVVGEAANLAGVAADACRDEGRPMGAANRSLPRSDDPGASLWQSITTLRESRGDGHGMALAMAGLDGVEAIIVNTAAGNESRLSIQARRGWTDAEWHAGAVRLRERGLLAPSPDDGLSTQGIELRARIEEWTDELSAHPWKALGDVATSRLIELLEPISHTIQRAVTKPSR